MNLNQILNTALMESTLTEGKYEDSVQYVKDTGKKIGDTAQVAYNTTKDSVKKTSQQMQDAVKPYTDKAGNAISSATDRAKKFYSDHEKEFKDYGPAALVALGAGIGAVALAKKLRNRKAAANQA